MAVSVKFYVLYALFVLATAKSKFASRPDLAECWDNLYEPYKNECLEESKASAEDVTDMFIKGNFPDETTFKCYVKCVQLKLNFMDTNGKYDKHTIKRMVKGADVDIIEQTLYEIRNERDLCQKAYLSLVITVPKIAERYPPNKEMN